MRKRYFRYLTHLSAWKANNIHNGQYELKVRKTAKIRKRYNQIPHLTQETTWESNKYTINITNKSQEVSRFPVGVHKAAMNRRKSMRNTRHKKHKLSTKKYRFGTVSKNILLEGLNQFHGANLALNSNVDQDTIGKRTKDKQTQHTRQPRGQPFPSS